VEAHAYLREGIVQSLPLLSWLLVALLPLNAHAGLFGVDPVRLTLRAGAMSTSLLLENKGDEPVLVQVELMAWSQEDGKEVLTPSQDLVVSPPIFKVAPGAAQTVRVGLLRPVDPERELTYRLFLQEVPLPMQGQVGVTVALRVGLPVFVLPRGRALPLLSWRATHAAEGQIELSLSNSGNAHVQAIDCKLYQLDGTLIAEHVLATYVLPGQARSWQIKPSQPWRGEKLKLTARTDGGEVTAEIAPD
jgi:fimbrial chaperone protein